MSGRVYVSFPGGASEIRKPTREALVLSAQQWQIRAHEELFELSKRDDVPAGCSRYILAASSALLRLDAVLAELEAACRE